MNGREMTRCVALLRGINVGRAKRIAMADLRSVIEGCGFTRVRTLLNSGNAVFEAARPDVSRIAATIEAAVERQFAFSVPVVVLTADGLGSVIVENPLVQVASDPSRHLVAFVTSKTALASARALLAESWTPDALAVGSRAAYLWCAGGLIDSRLMQAFSRATGEAATTRNWTTVLKLQAALGASDNAR